jgi:murein DD-endopeptidase MepM/ murein hydrolase activator NlpD
VAVTAAFVVVRDGQGVEMRYAHLSATLVKESDVVAPGTPVARVGRSGRSAAPHLHLEVLVNRRTSRPCPVGGSCRERNLRWRRPPGQPAHVRGMMTSNAGSSSRRRAAAAEQIDNVRDGVSGVSLDVLLNPGR